MLWRVETVFLFSLFGPGILGPTQEDIPEAAQALCFALFFFLGVSVLLNLREFDS